ncbi:MAG: Fis family transcriptional regulator [Deltaproteobacteria bacterium]|nr:Fis family transcriptional regulator [Deltaproteobacteria bacterium]
MRVLLLLLIVACSDEASNGEPADLVGLTAAHNATRAMVGVAPLEWNADLADLATGFIADCVFDHSSQAERSDRAGFAYIGENLYSATGFKPSGADITDAWASEVTDYDYESNSCAGTCGHYTQIVWAATTDVGCALKACGSGYLVSCEYGPGGNYQGQRPY